MSETPSAETDACPRAYVCPSSGEIECPCHGGFDNCCDHPDCPGNLRAAMRARLQALISEHASHGFTGYMRTANEGCPIYVAAVALDAALRAADHATPETAEECEESQ